MGHRLRLGPQQRPSTELFFISFFKNYAQPQRPDATQRKSSTERLDEGTDQAVTTRRARAPRARRKLINTRALEYIFIVSRCIPLYPAVSRCIPRYPDRSRCIPLYPAVSRCISHIPLYPAVSRCISLYPAKSAISPYPPISGDRTEWKILQRVLSNGRC